jgi:hypothetical protein
MKYYTILGHSGQKTNLGNAVVPQGVKLAFAASCGQTFEKNNEYRKLFRVPNTPGLNEYMSAYNNLMKNPNNPNVYPYWKRLVKHTNVHNLNTGTGVYKNMFVEIGPPQFSKSGRLQLLHGVYKLPANIKKNIANNSIVSTRLKSQVKLSNMLNIIKRNSGGEPVTVFGVFCRDTQEYQRGQKRNSPTRFGSRWLGPGSAKKFMSLRPLTSRTAVRTAIESAKRFRTATRELTKKPKSVQTVKNVVTPFWWRTSQVLRGLKRVRRRRHRVKKI